MGESNKARKKFPLTKRLMKLAREDGKSQEQIAKICRTQQSIVSAWSRGEGLAYEDQIADLLVSYGPILRKQTSKLYYSLDQKVVWTSSLISGLQDYCVEVSIGDAEVSTNLSKLDSEEIQKYIGKSISPEFVEELKARCNKCEKTGWEKLFFPKPKYTRVMGPILFQHTFKQITEPQKNLVHACYRVVVHEQETNSEDFTIALLRRGKMKELMHSQVEGGIWWLEELGDYTLNDLIRKIDGLAAQIFEHGLSDEQSKHSEEFKSEALVLPYALR